MSKSSFKVVASNFVDLHRLRHLAVEDQDGQRLHLPLAVVVAVVLQHHQGKITSTEFCENHAEHPSSQNCVIITRKFCFNLTSSPVQVNISAASPTQSHFVHNIKSSC